MKKWSEQERNFRSALQKFAAGDESQQSELFTAYNRLMASLKDDPDERERSLRMVFFQLAEHLDAAPGGEIARILYHYTFSDLLEFYGEEPAIRKAVADFLDSGEIRKVPLVIALGNLRREWAENS